MFFSAVAVGKSSSSAFKLVEIAIILLCVRFKRHLLHGPSLR